MGFDLEPAPNWLGQLTRLDSSFPAVLLMFLIAVLAAGCLILLGSCLTANWRNLRAPWLTKWFLRRETPWILRSIADTVDSGRPLPLGLAPLAVTYFRPHVRDKLSQVENEVVDGRDCWNALKDVGFIRASEAALLKAGSAVGNLSWTLRTLADRIQQRQRHRLKCVIESVWPFCVLFVGVFVLWFCLSVFVPFLRLVTALTAEPRL